MNRIENMDLGQGQSIGIEVGLSPLGTEDRLVSAFSDDKESVAFKEAVSRIRPMANQLLAALRDLGEAPKSVEVRFGIKISAEAGVVIARAATEANFEVKLTWERDAAPNAK